MIKPFHLAIAAAAIIPLQVSLADAAEARPNILLILADDLGYGDVRCLNPERGKIPTPHLDQLASQGMAFTDAHSGSSVCTPTRYGLLTGRYAWRTRLQKNVLDGYDQPLIARDRLTLPAMLKQQGYHTACIGKWHLGFTLADGAKAAKGDCMGAPLGTLTPDGPVTRGFDSFFGFHHARMMKSLFENDRVTRIVEPVDMLPLLVKQTRTHIMDRAKSGQPFFIYLALNSPHTPIAPNADWKGKSGLNPYADYVMQTDAAVGSVLAALDEAGIADQTLVIFSSDNGCSGPGADTAQLEAQGHFASAQFRGYKADIWEGGHRVPFFVRWPGKVKAATRSKQLTCLTDVMATCSEMLGQPLPENTAEDSMSILQILLGNADTAARESIVHHSANGRFAIRQGPWKLALCSGSGGWSSPKDAAAKKSGLPAVQLYQVENDPAESHNLAAEDPDRVAQLTKLLTKWVSDGRSTPGKPQTNDVPVAISMKGEQSSSD